MEKAKINQRDAPIFDGLSRCSTLHYTTVTIVTHFTTSGSMVRTKVVEPLVVPT